MTGPRPPHYVDLTDLERLRRGWARVWRSDGAFGGDGQSLTEFRQDLPAELARLQDELVDRRYRPRSLRACRIPKADGTCRKLLIPSVRDRVVQQAALSILGPWLDLQFETSSWAYRPGRSHLLALVKLREAWRAGYRWLAEGDIDHFFDRIDRSRLAGLLDLCLPDPELVEPLLAWMGGRAGYGIPQGAPVSPLLSNLYLDRFDEEVGLGGRRLVRFADDFVIATRSPMEAADALVAARRVLGAVGLRLNTEKTAIRAPSDSIAFLGSEMTGGALRTVARAPRPHVGRARRARGDGWSFWFPKRQRDAFRAGLTVPEADRRPTTRNGASALARKSL